MAKSKPINVLLGTLTIVAVLAIAPSAFGQMSMEVDIAKGAGSSANANCVAANNCFAPNPVTIAPGTEVEWKNTDTVGHTVTSGKPTDNDAGSLFDSSSNGLIKPGAEFKFTFQNEGTFNYFCQVHPWMTGQVTVSASSAAPTTTTSTPNPAGQGQQGGVPLGAPYGNQSAQTTPAPQQPLPNPAGQGQQGGVPLGSSYGTPAPTTMDPSLTGWITGIVVIGIMSGIGIWSAVRRR